MDGQVKTEGNVVSVKQFSATTRILVLKLPPHSPDLTAFASKSKKCNERNIFQSMNGLKAKTSEILIIDTSNYARV